MATADAQHGVMAIDDVKATPAPAGTADVLFDGESGLVREALLRLLVDQRIGAIRTHGRLDEVWVAVAAVRDASPGSTNTHPALVGDALTAALPDADLVGRLDDGRYVILFDRGREQSTLARLAAVRPAVEERCGAAVVHMGAAAYPQHGFAVDELLAAATVALGDAQAWPISRTEVAPLGR